VPARDIYVAAGRDLLFRLSDLLRDPLVLRTQFRIALEVLGQRAMQLILPAVGCDVTEDAQFVDVWVVLRIDSFEFWVQCRIAGAGQTKLARKSSLGIQDGI
jgi:hypothetical protein